MAISTTIGLESLPWEYDVFLSFRGEDTRKTFTAHLYSALHSAGIRTFRDEDELRRGEYLAPEFRRAIQNSRICMIVLSKNYASSRWCLEELLQILQCKEEGKQIVFPIFYDVHPSQVRNNRSGEYGEALANHEKRFQGSDKVEKWRDALTKIGNMSGWDLQGIANGYESKLMDEIIKEVILVVRRVPLFVPNHMVGLETKVDDVVEFMWREHDNCVRMIGIYGVGGVGKTTLAKVLYNKFFGYFERSCFLEVSSGISEIKKLQEELLSKLLNRKIEVGSEGEGIMHIKHWLQAKKCLIVLDNLEHTNQFNALCGERNWFGGGSRLILTTREVHVLKKLKKGEHYEAEELNCEESLQLFRQHAFGESSLPKEDYTELVDGIVKYCGGLPLALEVIGCYLSDKSKEEWISASEKLKKIPHKDVQAKLKISYDGLPDEDVKSLFLDLVCFSNGVSKKTIESIGEFSTIGIRDLTDRCLIKCHWGSWVSMHSLIREMGREIIRSESLKNPGERSRLWCPNDIHNVLIGEKGTKNIEVIVFNSPMKSMEYNTKAFKKMENLRFLEINGVHLNGNFKHQSKELRCLQWNDCPLKSIALTHSFEKLVMLEMQGSNIKEFGVPMKYFPSLESLDLGWSQYLTRTPDFSGAQNLRSLTFSGCKSLVSVHSSIGELEKLKYLNFRFCDNLKKLPNNLCKLSSLQSLHLAFCTKIKELPEDFGNLSSLQNLDLIKTHISGLPSSISHLSRLTSVELVSCEELEVVKKLPHSVENLSFDDCYNLQMIQEFPPKFRNYHLRGCRMLKMLPELPSNFSEFIFFHGEHLKMLAKLPFNLGKITLVDCENLEMLPELPPKLEYIKLGGCKSLKILPELPQNLLVLIATHCESMEKVPNLSNCKKLVVLDLRGCRKLKEIQGWENLEFLRHIKLKGVPHIKFSENMKQVLIGSKWDLERHVFQSSDNEIPSWIRCKEEGSSISFYWPSSNFKFLGICIWVVFKPSTLPSRSYTYDCMIEINGFQSILGGETIQLEVEEISALLCFSSWYFEDIKAGEVIKITHRPHKDVEECMVKKIGVEAVYTDTHGFKHFVPITKHQEEKKSPNVRRKEK